jgi:hypothetical protein
MPIITIEGPVLSLEKSEIPIFGSFSLLHDFYFDSIGDESARKAAEKFL